MKRHEFITLLGGVVVAGRTSATDRVLVRRRKPSRCFAVRSASSC